MTSTLAKEVINGVTLFLLLPAVCERRSQTDGAQFSTLHYGMSDNDSYLKRHHVLAWSSQSAPWQRCAVGALANYNPLSTTR